MAPAVHHLKRKMLGFEGVGLTFMYIKGDVLGRGGLLGVSGYTVTERKIKSWLNSTPGVDPLFKE